MTNDTGQRAGPSRESLEAELQAAQEELAFSQRANVHHRVPERLLAAQRRVDAARAAFDGAQSVPDARMRPLTDQSQPWTPEHCKAYPRRASEEIEYLRSRLTAGVGPPDADAANRVTLDRRDLFDSVRYAIKDALTTDENMNDEAGLWSDAHDRTVKCLERLYGASGVPPPPEGGIVVTWSGDEIVLVSRQDSEGRIFKIIAEKGQPPHAAGNPGAALRPCRSPYCECDLGKCTHPGCYDARGVRANSETSSEGGNSDVR